MLSKKSKIEQLPKYRERRCLPAVASASLCRTRTKLCGRLLVIRRGPSHRRARHAPAALKNLVHLPEKPFSTASVRLGRASRLVVTPCAWPVRLSKLTCSDDAPHRYEDAACLIPAIVYQRRLRRGRFRRRRAPTRSRRARTWEHDRNTRHQTGTSPPRTLVSNLSINRATRRYQ
jgi:hypothetical protein